MRRSEVSFVSRVFGGAWTPHYYLWTLTASGLCWVLSFAIFVWVYGPILISSRPDGRQG